MRRLGLEVEMWPNFDAYDLRITFPSGKEWAVDEAYGRVFARQRPDDLGGHLDLTHPVAGPA